MRDKSKLGAVSEVVESGLCVSCGACVVVAGMERMPWVYDKKLALHVPQVEFPGSEVDRGAAFAVCPGKGAEIMHLAEAVRSPKATYDVQLGYVLEACAVRSTDTRLLENASSGGLMTGLAHHLLSSGKATGVMSTRFTYGPEGPRPQASIVRDFEGLVECQGSKYCPVSIHDALESLQGSDERIAFIGTPCQIEALRMMMERLAWLREKIAFVIGSFCGGMKDYREMRALIRRQGIEPCEVVRFSFRGGGQPGRMRIEDSRGQVKIRPYPDYVTDTGFRKLKRCLLCIDGTAELADLACGDAWLPRFTQSSAAWSVAMARNEKGARVLREMRERGLIETKEISLSEIKESQRSNLSSKKKRQMARRRLYRLLGLRMPVYDGGMPETSTSLWLEFKVHLSHSVLRCLETFRLYWPFIKCARWVRGTNEYRKKSQAIRQN
jgi:coenzyme F420 hydrogenase subunit beta